MRHRNECQVGRGGRGGGRRRHRGHRRRRRRHHRRRRRHQQTGEERVTVAAAGRSPRPHDSRRQMGGATGGENVADAAAAHAAAAVEVAADGRHPPSPSLLSCRRRQPCNGPLITPLICPRCARAGRGTGPSYGGVGRWSSMHVGLEANAVQTEHRLGPGKRAGTVNHLILLKNLA